jgi:hypothetical protein
MYSGGVYYGLVIITPHLLTRHRSCDNLKRPYRIAFIYINQLNTVSNVMADHDYTTLPVEVIVASESFRKAWSWSERRKFVQLGTIIDSFQAGCQHNLIGSLW